MMNVLNCILKMIKYGKLYVMYILPKSETYNLKINFKNIAVVIILQYIKVSNQYVVPLKFHSYISQLYFNKAGEKHCR